MWPVQSTLSEGIIASNGVIRNLSLQYVMYLKIRVQYGYSLMLSSTYSDSFSIFWTSSITTLWASKICFKKDLTDKLRLKISSHSKHFVSSFAKVCLY